MPEARTIDERYPPLTVDLIAEQLAACGLEAGQTVLVHSALSRLGWVTGGPVTVVQALLRVLTPTGTLMMPTHTSDNSEPSYWQNPPVPEAWWPVIREHSPAFDPAITPTRKMGALVECFRSWPGVLRSGHPTCSFAALGPHAAFLTNDHRLESTLGEHSPLARLYDLDGYILLLGVDHGNNTSLHLAEYRAEWPSKSYEQQGSAVYVNGERRWVTYAQLALDDADFSTVGDQYEAEHAIPRGQVGRAQVRFMKQRPLIDYAVGWFERHRH